MRFETAASDGDSSPHASDSEQMSKVSLQNSASPTVGVIDVRVMPEPPHGRVFEQRRVTLHFTRERSVTGVNVSTA